MSESKINISIDLVDIISFEDNSEDVNSLIKDEIKRTVSLELRKVVGRTIKAEVSQQVSNELKSIGTGQLKKIIEAEVAKEFKTLEIKERYSDKKHSISEYVTASVKSLTDESLTDKLDKIITSVSSKAIKDLQEQYNSSFASSVITKLYDNDFLSKKAIAAIVDNSQEHKQ